MPLTDLELRDQLVTLLMAGHETTASALSWAFDHILHHPEIESRMRDEITRVMGTGPLDPARLGELTYLDAVIKDTHRLRSVIPNVARRLGADVHLDGLTLPAGSYLAPCMLLVQRDPTLFPDPERFDPTRWLDTKSDPYTWFPFGGGTRRCIGLAFANYEMKIVLATVFGAATLRPARRRAASVVRHGITLTPTGGGRVVLDSTMP